MTDKEYMQVALTLARSVKGQTSPNPPVGSVVVKNGRIIGMGAHLKAGEGHAEVQAIKMAGGEVEGATVYVTLEPCSHFGKTPPCSNLLIDSRVSRVVVATTDPNPLVAGKGIERIRKAGIEVEVGVLQEEANELYEMFFYYISTKKPYVTLKTALTLDGKTASHTGSSQWITGVEAREDVHKYRHTHDAILVGVNTVLKDDPSLTTRLPNGGLHPTRIVLDHHLRTPLDAKLVNDQESTTWIVVNSHVTEEQMAPFIDRGVKIIQQAGEKIDIPSLLEKLGELSITSILVEGGSEVNGSFLQHHAFNQVVTYIAPKLIGGKLAPGFIGGTGIADMNDAAQLQYKSIEQLGEDIKIVAVPYHS
ncbi:bifunctional diaminohydroxyphosphoribosylaminopyrimidine deaminase/5-amino-6-(5-phosphoribosylamino)uracil reductase RibD [Bacillus suaedaesalsae]|uniref:Riboflavin biosynthesis protein RibD n=1 Tax=Bacillus suaedaesalsae TaxID=2810349 RepID=A0ABS2DN99_9BACI|nr:bifunctional diaminohydroxyphosphoribosylaminopyrimidine deaminase/5-amino-6-(5-phosphoribosylamino)uracil reductase RibD [Bacillus suaedaesalsae]MBM6619938.1 bifunctional diaminohydroxyphosphoribosylaminopyrimidine deaminase/5-amino-6-(5-phosphoribosylamino)uracil reductase RibD [Bacillus suaedaesalsae]